MNWNFEVAELDIEGNIEAIHQLSEGVFIAVTQYCTYSIVADGCVLDVVKDKTVKPPIDPPNSPLPLI